MSASSLLTLIGLLLLFPLLVVVLGEIQLRLQRGGWSYGRNVGTFRNFVLPLFAAYALLIYVGGLSSDNLVAKLVITLGIIIGLVALIGIINGLIFERRAGAGVPQLFLDLIRVFIVTVGIAIVLSAIWGYDLNNLITALGVSSIVLGLALQDTLGNLFNGITLINEKPFRVGDFIQVGDHSGKVVEVNWRAVRLLTRERDLIVLPHLTVAQSAIINHSQPEEHWAQKLELGFSYDNAPNRVKRVILETCLGTPGVLRDPEPEVKVDNFADSAVLYEVEYYIESFGKREEIKDNFMSRVWYAARRHGFSIPFPQLNIHREPQRELASALEERQAGEFRFTLERLGIGREAEQLLEGRDYHWQDFGESEPIIEPGAAASGLYFLLNGEVIITATDADGDIVELARLHRGDFFTPVLARGRRLNVITVEANEDCACFHFKEDSLRKLVNRYPKLAISVDEAIEVRKQQISQLRQRV